MANKEKDMKIYNGWYSIEDNKLKIHTVQKGGTKTIDCTLKPYCYILAQQKDDIKQTYYIDKKNNPHPINIQEIESTSIKSLDGQPLIKLVFNFPYEVSAFRNSNSHLTVLEADVPFIRRYMIDNDINIDTDYNKLYYDIETKGPRDQEKIICISIEDNKGGKEYLYGDEKAMITQFLNIAKNYQMLIGWNNIGYDRPIIIKRAMELNIIRLPTKYQILAQDERYQRAVQKAIERAYNEKIGNAIEIDLMQEYKKISSETNYSLDYVAKKVTGHGKLPIDWNNYTPEELKDYNANDVKITKEIDDKMDITNMRIELASISHIFPSDATYASRVIDSLILKKAQQIGIALPTRKKKEDEEESKGPKYKGGHVEESHPGIYSNVAVLDFKGMYTTIIMVEKISPDKEKRLLPELVKEIVTKRKEYKTKFRETGDKKFDIKQEVYKIIGNACYGVFGASFFRVYKKEIAEQITAKGREKIAIVRQLLEDSKYNIVYGDTDSIFAGGKSLDEAFKTQTEINEKIKPYTVEFEKFFTKILFTAKTSGKGIKKKYAGYLLYDSKISHEKLSKEELKIAGLEVIRTDNFDLLQNVQKECIINILHGASKKDILYYAEQIKQNMKKGKHDEQLILRRGMGKKLEDYKVKTPQVKVAQKLIEQGLEVPLKLQYVMTLDKGVEPVINGKIPENIDYVYYLGRLKLILARLLSVFKLSEKEIQRDICVFDYLNGRQTDIESYC